MVKLDDRLLAVAHLAGNCKMAADVGSDHGYLAIYLVSSGQAEMAVASDVNRMPLDASRRNIQKEGLEDKILLRLSDGMKNICDLCPDTVIIAGMGGELIADIIKKSPHDYCKIQTPTLVLQPMTSAYELCSFLASEGYEISDECITVSSGKIYRAMKARYTGKKQEMSLLELHVGRLNLARGDEMTATMVGKLKTKYEKIVKGKELSGQNSDFELEMLREIDCYLRKAEFE